MKKNFLKIGLLLLLGIAPLLVSAQQKKGAAWRIPAQYKNMKMMPSTDVNKGKMLYNKHCKSCHGTRGKGDGVKARRLKTGLDDFTSNNFKKAYSDGELYYMSIIGRDEMPNYETKIPVKKDRWNVIAYIKSLE